MKAAYLLPLAIAACVAVPHQGLRPAPVFSPQAFFAGRTEGEGQLSVIFSARRLVRVHGTGRAETDGTLILDQVVEEAAKPPRRREWRIRETAPGRFTGTLSDAASPVTGEVNGNRLHLRFRLKGGLTTDQWLYLAPDGRSARNYLRVRKLGITVGALNEMIRKVD